MSLNEKQFTHHFKYLESLVFESLIRELQEEKTALGSKLEMLDDQQARIKLMITYSDRLEELSEQRDDLFDNELHQISGFLQMTHDIYFSYYAMRMIKNLEKRLIKTQNLREMLEKSYRKAREEALGAFSLDFIQDIDHLKKRFSEFLNQFDALSRQACNSKQSKAQQDKVAAEFDNLYNVSRLIYKKYYELFRMKAVPFLRKHNKEFCSIDNEINHTDNITKNMQLSLFEQSVKTKEQIRSVNHLIDHCYQVLSERNKWFMKNQGDHIHHHSALQDFDLFIVSNPEDYNCRKPTFDNVEIQFLQKNNALFDKLQNTIYALNLPYQSKLMLNVDTFNSGLSRFNDMNDFHQYLLNNGFGSVE